MFALVSVLLDSNNSGELGDPSPRLSVSYTNILLIASLNHASQASVDCL